MTERGPGRPLKGVRARTGRILICLEPGLRAELEALAEEANRSISDYCRYVLEQHFWAIREEQGLAERNPEE